MKDYTMADDGNDSKVLVSPDTKELINFGKFKILAEVSIFPLLKHQSDLSTVNIVKTEPLYTFLYNLPTLTDKELYRLSLEIEPRN